LKRTIHYIIVLLFIFGCNSKQKPEQSKVLVFCAASLTNVISELADSFQVKYNVAVQLNFASSGTLVRQIENGALPSLYISANKKWISYLTEKDKTILKYEKQLARNSLVIVVPVESKTDSLPFGTGKRFPESFEGRLSIGDPKHVPAGEYVMQAIKSAGYAIKLKDRLLPAKDVRSALMVVELGEAEAGIVYKTDAAMSKKVKIAAEIPSALHAPIGYFISVLKNFDENTLHFYDYLNSETAKQIWIKNKFIID